MIDKKNLWWSYEALRDKAFCRDNDITIEEGFEFYGTVELHKNGMYFGTALMQCPYDSDAMSDFFKEPKEAFLSVEDWMLELLNNYKNSSIQRLCYEHNRDNKNDKVEKPHKEDGADDTDRKPEFDVSYGGV